MTSAINPARSIVPFAHAAFVGVRRAAVSTCFSILVAAGSGGPVCADVLLASPAIDESLFKDGIVEQRETQHGFWHLKCQQIVKMRRRYCNLLSSVVDKDGKSHGAILIATDDTGQPTIMLALTQPVRLDKPLLVSSTFEVPSKKNPVRVEYKKAVSATLCDISCKFLFAADSQLIFSLNAGKDVSVRVTAARTLQQRWFRPPIEGDAVTLTVHGNGFANALKASKQTW